MKKLTAIFMLIAICIGMSSCGASNSGEVYFGETAVFESGLAFSVVDKMFSTKYGLYEADEGNKYVFVKIRIANNTKEVYTADGSEVWLDCDGAKIGQLNIVRRIENGFYSVSQSPTTTVEYVAAFQVGEQIEFSDLALVVDNGSWLDNERVKIWLTEKGGAENG